MRRLAILGVLLVAGCAAPAAIIPASQQAVTSIELEYVSKFLVPTTAYSMLPRCPQADGKACSDPATVATLRDTQAKLHDAIYGCATSPTRRRKPMRRQLIANTRAQLAAAEASVPEDGAKP